MNAPAALAQDEAFARIRLLRSPNVGPISYAQLLRRFGNAQAASSSASVVFLSLGVALYGMMYGPADSATPAS